MDLVVIVETDRLVIRPFREADINAYAAIVADPDVMRYLTGKTESYDDAAQYIRECIASERDRGYSRYAVVLKETRQLIGFCGFKQINDEIDFGWRYAREHWGQGIGTEAAGAVLEYGLEALKLPLVVSVSLPENIGSIRIMQKLGMTPDGHGDWDGKQTVRYIAKRGL